MASGFTEQLTQKLSIPIGSLVSNLGTGNNNTITAIPLKNYKRLMAHIIVGLPATPGTVTAYFMGCNTSGGTYAVLSPNTSIALNAVNTEGTLEVRSDQFNSGNQFAQLTVNVASTASNVAMSVFGGESHYSPANQFDANTTIVAVRTVV